MLSMKSGKQQYGPPEDWQINGTQSTLLAMCVSVKAQNSLRHFSCQTVADEPTVILLKPTGLISTCTVILISARKQQTCSTAV